MEDALSFGTLRAEQWIMLAVVGLGAFAAYRLIYVKPGIPGEMPLQPGAQPALGPAGTLPADIRVPSILGRNAAAGHAILSARTPYRGRVDLGARDDATFARELAALGFTKVEVYSEVDLAANPDAIPLPDALLNPAPTTRWFSATWAGNGMQPRATVRLPAGTQLLWYTASEPPPRRAPAALLASTPTWQPLSSAAFAPISSAPAWDASGVPAFG